MTRTTQRTAPADIAEIKPPIKVKFGTAGIRGLFGHDVSVRETVAVCFAVNELMGEGRFGLAYDSRDSSFVLATTACSAMNWYGSDVENYGMVPTPVLAYNIRRNKLHAGFSVTASHNPPEYAGVKVFGTDGIEFSLEEEQKLEKLVEKSSGYAKSGEKLTHFGITYPVEDAIDVYRDAVMQRASSSRRMFRVLVDCANGTSSQVTPKILSELGHDVVTINAHSSNMFPGRLPEPMEETLVQVSEFARLEGVDFVVAHDGDADRVVMIDSKGKIVPDYALSVLVLKIILERSKRGTVIISYNSSDAIAQVAEEAGCKVMRSRLGKTFQDLYNQKGIFAAEPSKVVDPKWGYWEDGIYAAVLITQFLSEHGITIEEAMSSLPVYHNFRKDLMVNMPLNYDLVKERIRARFSDDVESIEDIDGVKVRLKSVRGGWLMLRSSGTENKVRVYSESLDKAEGSKLLDEGVAIVTPFV